MGQRLVLQRALPALVAHRAVERVVDQQELDRALLALARDVAGQVRAHLHVGRAHGSAGHQRLRHALDLDHALAAGPDGVQQRVVAEARDDRPELLGGADHERPLGDGDLLAVDGQRDLVVAHTDALRVVADGRAVAGREGRDVVRGVRTLR